MRLGWLWLLALLPIADLALLIWLGREVGAVPVLVYVVVTALLGYWLARRRSLRVLTGILGDLAMRRAPAYGLVDGLLVLIGGALLIFPGVITDVLGLLCILPYTRAGIKGLVRGAIERRVRSGALRVVRTR